MPVEGKDQVGKNKTNWNKKKQNLRTSSVSFLRGGGTWGKLALGSELTVLSSQMAQSGNDFHTPSTAAHPLNLETGLG